MAITKTTSILSIYVSPAEDTSAADSANAKYPTIEVNYQELFDDPDDSLLPVTTNRYVYLSRYVEDGGSATDYSGEEALVRTIAAAIWT